MDGRFPARCLDGSDRLTAVTCNTCKEKPSKVFSVNRALSLMVMVDVLIVDGS